MSLVRARCATFFPHRLAAKGFAEAGYEYINLDGVSADERCRFLSMSESCRFPEFEGFAWIRVTSAFNRYPARARGRHARVHPRTAMRAAQSSCLSARPAALQPQAITRRSATHAQTKTVAWSLNSICVVTAGYPRPAIPYYYSPKSGCGFSLSVVRSSGAKHTH